jgi:hypothetical protein
MFRVREVIELTRGLDPLQFEQKLGPFALLQRPQADARKAKVPKIGSTEPLPLWNQQDPAPVEFEALQVARLPPTLANGLMRLVIGRSEECDLVVEDPAVSARHAVIHWNGSAGVLIELGSSNGTFVNDKKMTGDAVLNNGDHLAFGRAHFIYYLAGDLKQRLERLDALSSS